MQKTYDLNGNTTTKTDSSGTTTYAWDFENRLTSVTLPGSGGTVSFIKYDPFGRRIYKSSSAATSIFAYDGHNLIEETNSSGAAVARYSQGLHIYEPLATERSGTTGYYQRQLRHSDPRITLGIYGHVVGDQHRKAVQNRSTRLVN